MSSNGVYPRSCETVKGKILNQIVCGKRRFIGEKKRSWILILPMFQTRVALILLYIALFIIDSDILIVQLYLGLPLYSL